MKPVVEHGIIWTKKEALSSVRESHGVEGFLGECVTSWYDSLSLLKPGANVLVWPYINAPQISKLMKNKLPILTFSDLEGSTVLAIKLNFLGKGQKFSNIGDAVISRKKAWQKVAHRSRKHFTD
jgi:hypothetical protein